jgi:predicted DNA-binding antitoxin AbrB/MazE fold protein
MKGKTGELAGEEAMGLEIEAVYENGVLRLEREVPLEAGQRVRLTIQPLEQGSTPQAFAEWKKGFDAWMADVQARAHRYPPGFVMDDSREKIYEGCGR